MWILRGSKAGDFAQMRALARALGWPFEVRKLAFVRWELLLHAWPRPTLSGVDRSVSDALAPPWPDLVITAGRRNELPARWIRAAADQPVRLVHVGRPWSRPEQFDLVICNAQYALAPSGRVLVNELPLNDAASRPTKELRARCEARFETWPRPRTVVLLGGSSGPFVLKTASARKLGRALAAFVARHGGSVLISDSPRTPAGVVEALIDEAQVPMFVNRFAHGAANAYPEMLATADRFVVTADSVSMLTEASATGRPVYVYDPRPSTWLGRATEAWRWRPLVDRATRAFGPRRMRRDVVDLERAFVASGAWRYFDADATPFTPTRAPGGGDLSRAVERVRALFEAR